MSKGPAARRVDSSWIAAAAEAVVISADFISPGAQLGCAAFTSAATPDTWGQAMEVPDITLNPVRRGSDRRQDGPVEPVHAASTLTPGARRSGFRTRATAALGPREENDATAGAGRPRSVPSEKITAVGSLLLAMYLSMDLA
ncbi:unnamed protein product [Spirodela intermedia]|uniref:Uncharacterized protein n=1 Tax=Spirodela intermedia TaxID=51605 RepID=A0A7I8KN36_SPIIN|nr:unnamed protein product [Spirodela intermedia]